MLPLLNLLHAPLVLETIAYFGMLLYYVDCFSLFAYHLSILMVIFTPMFVPIFFYLVRLIGVFIDGDKIDFRALISIVLFIGFVLALVFLSTAEFFTLFYIVSAISISMENIYMRVDSTQVYFSAALTIGLAIVGNFLAPELVLLFLHTFHTHSISRVWRFDAPKPDAFQKIIYLITVVLTLSSILVWNAASYTTPPNDSLCSMCKKIFVDARINIDPASGLFLTTPDAALHYASMYTRDYAYMLDYGPIEMTSAPQTIIPYLFSSGFPPEKIIASMRPIPIERTFYTRNSTDNVFFSMNILLKGPEYAWEKYYLDWRKTYTSLSRTSVNGFLINPKLTPTGHYGFMDTVRLTGTPLFVNLLMYDTLGRILQEHPECADREEYIETRRLFNESISVFRKGGVWLSACIDCSKNAHVTDVWGTMYAASLGLFNETETRWIENQIPHLLKKGGLPHVLDGEAWDDCWGGICPERGSYQNGGYWMTPLGWTLSIVQNTTLKTWMQAQVEEYAASMIFPEWVGPNGQRPKTTGYVVSCSNTYSLLCNN